MMRTAILAGALTSGCDSDQYTTECYSRSVPLADWRDEACKPASTITASDLSDEGSMIFQSAESGPTRTVVRTDCCSYDVAETVRCGAPRDGQVCENSSTSPENLRMCLSVTPDAGCPGQLEAGVPLQRQNEGLQIVTVSSPSMRTVTVQLKCCYVVRRRWDGG